MEMLLVSHSSGMSTTQSRRNAEEAAIVLWAEDKGPRPNSGASWGRSTSFSTFCPGNSADLLARFEFTVASSWNVAYFGRL